MTTDSHRIELRSRPDQHFVYSGRSLLVTDVGGWITGRGIEGFYVDNTRLIARDEVFVGDHRLESFAATPVGGDGLLAYAEVPASAGVPERSVFVEIARFVGEGLRTTLRVSNHAPTRVKLDVSIRLAADFADQQEAHEGKRKQTAEVSANWDR